MAYFAQKMSKVPIFRPCNGSILRLPCCANITKYFLSENPARRRRMVAPMQPPIRGELQPLTGHKRGRRVISDMGRAFETDSKPLRSKKLPIQGLEICPFYEFWPDCDTFRLLKCRSRVFFVDFQQKSLVLPFCLAVACPFPAHLSIAPSTAPAIPFIAPRLPETSLYHLAFQSFPSLSLLPNISSAPSLVLIDMDT
ncbi:hypothetical protein [Burkholderia diffusa]|uniref:hypothetical protein n=1 Tax=Burkholderia diffusa TaxID=488732 RepID=UPI001248A6A4|nr:hypothetical protein [Burkholderia diffusa]KAB0662185.1 hypothetical protein F7R23_03680 [Burkholderia diffusa]MBM2652273.1 hypothetical protein [Burkholderia diffusa]